ncbi:histidine kinase [Streptomyces sp. TRM 70361]|uniref:sensor histidine kinase n=1 Tax=Streptomyces sp. TRM 70361 TaxID=3116553 RepID=UPI002E7B6414|nr:histidine kinase [Streptomyces sp. TRM 70361]MEE1941719.1 histidine kinase [Streptomyces sp. TRM 70361]
MTVAVEGGALGWVRRVRRSSGPARFHQYTRYTIYSFAFFEGLMLLGWIVAQTAGPAVWSAAVLGLLFTAHVVCQLLLSRAGLRYYLGTAERPVRLTAVYLALTVAGIAGALALTLSGVGELSPSDALPLVAWLVMFLAGPLPLVLPAGRSAGLVAALLAASVLAAGMLGAPARGLVATVVGGVLGSLLFGVSYRCSAWTMRVVSELEAARETQARLAVAEERLRFGRDLHDVLGRNLSVIALKSELAVQLARRGSASAVDQMTEVQRIARESQREMREVVRGYREADLHTELVGARGVLRAAGIDCRIEDSGSGELPGALQSALGWVVREGTTNVLRHADARWCVIRLRTGPGDGPAELAVENDGATSPRAAAGGGSGLAGLRERLVALGGTLTGERHGGTFLLTARVPVRTAGGAAGRATGEDAGEDGTR